MKDNKPKRVKQLVSAKAEEVVTDEPPLWYTSPTEQIEIVKKFLSRLSLAEEMFYPWDIPSVPKDVSLKQGEVLMLAVYLPETPGLSGEQNTLKGWWDFFEPKRDYKKEVFRRMLTKTGDMSISCKRDNSPGMRWIVFNPNANPAISPSKLWRDPNSVKSLAGSEVIMAMSLFPNWPLMWDGQRMLFPNLANYVTVRDTITKSSPYLAHDQDRICLIAGSTDIDREGWCSPTVRACYSS